MTYRAALQAIADMEYDSWTVGAQAQKIALAALSTPPVDEVSNEPDVVDIIAGALQCSRAYAYTLIERAAEGRWK